MAEDLKSEIHFDARRCGMQMVSNSVLSFSTSVDDVDICTYVHASRLCNILREHMCTCSKAGL